MSDNPTLRELEQQYNMARSKEERKLEREKHDMKSSEKEFIRTMKEALQDEGTRRNLARQALAELQGEGDGGRLLSLTTDREGTIGYANIERDISIQEIKRKAWERE